VLTITYNHKERGLMTTNCTLTRFEIQGPGRRIFTANFNGGKMTSDAGALLLKKVDQQQRLIQRLTSCFVDARNPLLIEHSVEQLLRQRIFAISLGYEDLNDHEDLRSDALLAAVIGKTETKKKARRRRHSMAGKSTLNRLEWGREECIGDSRYHRIAVQEEKMKDFFVDTYLRSRQQPPEQLILDFDATDNPLFGDQEGKFYHGYYGCYCYLPLYVFCGHSILWAQLRESNIDASAGSLDALKHLVAKIRECWPTVSILLRADSGFARDELMSWCEQNGVDYLLGLARNQRLEALLEPSFEQVEQLCAESGAPERAFTELRYRTLKSWSRERRVIGKAEITHHGPNPRFVVTSLATESVDARQVYEELYCARGDAENRIKEQQLDLFSTRTSGQLMRVNQVRLWLSAVAYTLLNALRELGLVGSEYAQARCETIRLKLLKIGAHIQVSCRRIWVRMNSSCPYQYVFAHAWAQLDRS
jgi:hypothetical protein